MLGYKHRPKYRQRNKSAAWEVAVEKPVYDLTIFKLHCGKLRLQIYTKGERVLRLEVVVRHTEQLRCGRFLEKFPEIIVQAKSIWERFMDALSSIDPCFVADRMPEQLPARSQVGKTKVGGIDRNQARMRWVSEAVISGAFFRSAARCFSHGVSSGRRAARRALYSEYSDVFCSPSARTWLANSDAVNPSEDRQSHQDAVP
jgi:hypothetical protein